jgi:hypothetical protein
LNLVRQSDIATSSEEQAVEIDLPLFDLEHDEDPLAFELAL